MNKQSLKKAMGVAATETGAVISTTLAISPLSAKADANRTEVG